MNSRSNAPPLSPKRRWRLQLHPTLAPTHGLLSACFYLCLLVCLRLSLSALFPLPLSDALSVSLSLLPCMSTSLSPSCSAPLPLSAAQPLSLSSSACYATKLIAPSTDSRSSSSSTHLSFSFLRHTGLAHKQHSRSPAHCRPASNC